MRQLLLTTLGAAGAMLIDLPSLAQISNTTSTFSGQIAANCSINLPQSIALQYLDPLGQYAYDRNKLRIFDEFHVTTNFSEIRVSIDSLVVNNEPQPLASAITAKISVTDNLSTGSRAIADKSSGSQNTSFINTLFDFLPMRLYLEFDVETTGKSGGNYELPPGNYSYTATVSCLQ